MSWAAALWKAARCTGIVEDMRLKPSTAGLVGAHVMSWVSLSPSFIPRTWWMTAVSTGFSQAFGYLVGAAGHGLARSAVRLTGAEIAVDSVRLQPMRERVPWVMAGISAVAWLRSVNRQAEICGLMETRPIPLKEHAYGTVMGAALGASLIQAGRALTAGGQAVSRVLRPALPEPAAALAGAVVAGAVTTLVLDKVVYRRLLERVSRAAQETNDLLLPGRFQPTEPERSGSPASLEPWDTLGSKGQAVVSDGPRAVDIQAATGKPALTPIRSYAGWREDRDLEATAQAVVAELRRTGGFGRKVLLVITTTGTGWLPEWSVSAVEFLTGGDCALAAMQYTYLPSGVAMVADRATPAAAGDALLRAVEAELDTVPEGERPMLLVGGESLGALGGTTAFDGLSDMLERVDGAVWTGMPRISGFWRQVVSRRRLGTPEILPVVDDGRHVRFVSRPRDLVTDITGVDYGEWHHPRVVVAQHPSDPVVWWSPELMWREPEWAREQAGSDVSRSVRWMPWVTFWQVASDMPRSATVPGGHGHRYLEEMVSYWAAVLGLDPLEDRSRIVQAIRRLIVPSEG